MELPPRIDEEPDTSMVDEQVRPLDASACQTDLGAEDNLAQEANTTGPNPFDRLTERQQNILRCITCVVGQGLEAKNESIALCTGISAHSIGQTTRALQARGDLEGNETAHKNRMAYSPSEAMLPFLPTPPPKNECKVAQAQAKLHEPLDSRFFAYTPITSQYDDEPRKAFNAWLKKYSKYPVLSPEQCAELSKIAHGPDEDAATVATHRLIDHNIRLVPWTLRRNRGVLKFASFEDAVEAGILGLHVAIQKFDLEKNITFSTHAVWWIRHHMQREAQANSGLPSREFKMFYPVRHAARAFHERKGRMPSTIELTDELGMPLTTVVNFLGHMRNLIGIDEVRLDRNLAFSDAEVEFHDIVGTEDSALVSSEMPVVLQKLVDYLDPFENDVLERSVLGGVSLEAMLKDYGKAMHKLKMTRDYIKTLLKHPYFGISGAYDESLAWQDDAHCAKTNQDAVIKDEWDLAKQVCSECPVNRQCLDYANQSPPPIVSTTWGGVNFKTKTVVA